MIECHAELGEVLFVASLDIGDEGFRRYPGLLRRQHDRRAVGVIGANEMHCPTRHPPRAHPDVGLDVPDQVAKVQRAVGVGQGIGDECVAGHRGHRCEMVCDYRMQA